LFRACGYLLFGKESNRVADQLRHIALDTMLACKQPFRQQLEVPDADGVIIQSLEHHVHDMRSIKSRGGYSELYALSIAFEKRFVIHMAHSSATVTVLDAYPPHLSRLADVPEELRVAYVNGVHYDPIVPMLPEDEVS
jgi:hypothetical protein